MHTEPENVPAAALRKAAYNADLNTITRLLDEAVDVNVADKWGRTALFFAAGRGHGEIVEYLLSRGACTDPHKDYDLYKTPLVAASENGHINIVKTLIAIGANPMLHVGVSQATAEFYARQNGHSEVAAYLRKVMERSPEKWQ